MKNGSKNRIVFYDGDCGLCNRFIQFLLKIDTRKRLYFSPLQGKTAKKALPKTYIKRMNTMVFSSEGKTFYKSTAVIEIFRTIGFPWNFLVIGYILPSFLRNKIYDFVAKRRKQWFPDLCALDQRHKGRFLE